MEGRGGFFNQGEGGEFFFFEHLNSGLGQFPAAPLCGRRSSSSSTKDKAWGRDAKMHLKGSSTKTLDEKAANSRNVRRALPTRGHCGGVLLRRVAGASIYRVEVRNR